MTITVEAVDGPVIKRCPLIHRNMPQFQKTAVPTIITQQFYVIDKGHQMPQALCQTWKVVQIFSVGRVIIIFQTLKIYIKNIFCLKKIVTNSISNLENRNYH